MGGLLLKHVKAGHRKLVIQAHRQAVLLRRLVSMSTRITSITQEEVDEIQVVGRKMHQFCATYDSADMTPTTWCLANVMPVHTKLTYEKYGFGIGCNTMEGREQKHQKIDGYQDHSTFNSRWSKTFQHESVELRYLRLNGFDKKVYKKRSVNYIPNASGGCRVCKGTINEDKKCPLCDHALNTTIDEEVASVPKTSKQKK